MRGISRWSRVQDRLASLLIRIGGMSVIACVLGILVMIGATALPLFLPAQAQLLDSGTLPQALHADNLQSVGLDAYGEIAYAITTGGELLFFHVVERRILERKQLPRPPQQHGSPGSSQKLRVLSVSAFRDRGYSIFWSDGALSMVRIDVRPRFVEGGRRMELLLEDLGSSPPWSDLPLPTLSIGRYDADAGWTRISVLPDGRLHLLRRLQKRTLFGEIREELRTDLLPLPEGATITQLEANAAGDLLYAGTQEGQLLGWRLKATPRFIGQVSAGGEEITALRFLLGETTLLSADSAGHVRSWLPFPPSTKADTPLLRQVQSFVDHQAPVHEILIAHRKRMLFSVDESGVIQASYATTGRHLLGIQEALPTRLLALSPRDTHLIALHGDSLWRWRIDAPYPEAGWRAYFSPLLYEGYEEPQYIWQSSAANDDFEPKLSLVPLVIGTLKATIYGMGFAAPLGILAAIYASQFLLPRWRGRIKSLFEIVGSAPTVVVGFLAAQWLAPLLHTSLLGLLFLIGLLPLAVVGAFALYSALFSRMERLRGREMLCIAPSLVFTIWLAFQAATWMEWAFGITANEWLSMQGVTVDRRNAIVIAFALGFAVLPIVFTLSEDALSNVPRRLAAASLALGATRWQTVWRVILPSAAAGVFVACMVGLGRAVGETMIVLMAAGNTPLIDLSPFNGMRALSANIAVEIPEAPHGETLYRTLFFSGVLLFLATFLINAVAETLRSRLQKRYSRL